jgi:hypothetical protein
MTPLAALTELVNALERLFSNRWKHIIVRVIVLLPLWFAVQDLCVTQAHAQSCTYTPRSVRFSITGGNSPFVPCRQAVAVVRFIF